MKSTKPHTSGIKNRTKAHFGCYQPIEWALSAVISAIDMGQKGPATTTSRFRRSLSYIHMVNHQYEYKKTMPTFCGHSNYDRNNGGGQVVYYKE